MDTLNGVETGAVGGRDLESLSASQPPHGHTRDAFFSISVSPPPPRRRRRNFAELEAWPVILRTSARAAIAPTATAPPTSARRIRL